MFVRKIDFGKRSLILSVGDSNSFEKRITKHRSCAPHMTVFAPSRKSS